ncbi:MAG: hypothetical protein ACJBCI_03690 [Candidatus Tisiphia sp.]
MQKKSTNYHNNIYSVLKISLYFVPILLSSIDVYAAFDLDAGMKAATEPVKKMINDYYPVGIFITGAIGALMQQQGDLRDKMLGFGKGALCGGLTLIAVKTGLGV